MLACCADGVPHVVSTDNNMFIIGNQPTKDDLKNGQLFTGSNGKLLSACLSAVNLDIADFYLGNVMCGPNCTIEKGLTYLGKQINQYQPRIVITLGAPCCETVLGVKLGSVRGQMIPNKWGYYLPTVMPIAALQGGGASVGSDLVRDFKKIPYILDFKPKPFKYEVVNDRVRAQHVLAFCDYNSIDIETQEVPTVEDVDQENAWDWQLECLAVGDTEHAYVFPADVCAGLEWPKIGYTGHNAWSFDRAGINRYLGVTLDIQEDTLLAAYALDERRISSIRTPLLKLKPLCREYIGADNWESHKSEDVYKYNAQDVINTARLLERLTAMMIEDNVYDLYRNLLIPAAKVLSDAQIYGCKIDVNELVKLLVAWVPKLDAMEKHLQAEANEYGWPTDTLINCNSPQQLAKLLFELIGLPIGHYTKAGKPSTNKEVLNDLDHPFVTVLLEHRALDKVISGYLLSAKKHLKYDGRIHPKPLQHGTVTGRPSYTDPPVQTIPQEHTVGSLAELRRMFIPSSPEYDILEADYAQLDLWMAACLSGDKQMLLDLQEPYWPDGTADFHSRVTEGVLHGDPLHAHDPWGSTDRKIWEELRFRSKKVSFGIAFMEGPNGLASKHTGIGCTVSEAKKYIDAWYKRYPVFKEWQRAIVKEAHDNGEIVSIFGRKRRFPLIVDHRSDRQAGNFPIQSAESDCTLTSAIELHPQLLALDSHILFLVHDSIVIERSLKYAQEVALLVKTVMEKPRHPALASVPIEMKAGPNWYDTHRVAA